MASPPNELILRVLGCLKKHELKTARFVCKTWCQYASESLFKKLYISPREEDIKVFESVTQHPQLCRCVKELEYDATRFSSSLSRFKYFSSVCAFTYSYQERFSKTYNAQNIRDFDPQMHAFITLLNGDNLWNRNGITLAYQECKDYDFLVEGYRKWLETASFQDSCIRSGDFARILISGLRNLGRLESLYVCNSWDTHLPEDIPPHQAHCYNSPFGRTWTIFRARPEVTAWDFHYPVQPNENDHSTEFDDFWIITTALAHAQKRMRRLGTRILSPIVFDHNHMVDDRVKCSVNVYSHLETLDLSFSQNQPASNSPSRLLSILESTTRLRKLRLSFLENYLRQGVLFAVEEVLPSTGKWMLLTFLSLNGMSTSAMNLRQLLTVGTPKLKVLTLGNIGLLQGRWEGVVEAMKQSMHLSVWFVLDSLTHLGGQKFITGDGVHKSDSKWIFILGNYVVNGGRHPCLLPDELDSASDKFLSAPWL